MFKLCESRGTFTKTDIVFSNRRCTDIFSQIRVMFHTFLLVLHKVEYATAVEVHFIIPEPCTHSFMDCHVILVSLSWLWYFKVLNWGGQMQTSKDGRTFPCTFQLLQISDMLCEVVLCVEEWCIYSRLLITKCTLQFMACLNVVSSINGFPTGHKINQHSGRQFP